jgi:hypothetical protein
MNSTTMSGVYFLRKYAVIFFISFLFTIFFAARFTALFFFKSFSELMRVCISKPDSAFGCNSTFLAAIWMQLPTDSVLEPPSPLLFQDYPPWCVGVFCGCRCCGCGGWPGRKKNVTLGTNQMCQFQNCELYPKFKVVGTQKLEYEEVGGRWVRWCGKRGG